MNPAVRVGQLAAFGAIWLAAQLVPAVAHAQDEPLLAAPSEYTDVIDAFDGEDVIDIQARIEFRSTFSSAVVQREVIDETTGQTGNDGRFRDLLDHSAVRNELQLGLEVGLYHDIMMVVGLPIVLSDDEELTLVDGRDCDDTALVFRASCTSRRKRRRPEVLFTAGPRCVEQRSAPRRSRLLLRLPTFSRFRRDLGLRAERRDPDRDAKNCVTGISASPVCHGILAYASRVVRAVFATGAAARISRFVGSRASRTRRDQARLRRRSLPTTTESSAGARSCPEAGCGTTFSIGLLVRAANSRSRSEPALRCARTLPHAQIRVPR